MPLWIHVISQKCESVDASTDGQIYFQVLQVSMGALRILQRGMVCTLVRVAWLLHDAEPSAVSIAGGASVVARAAVGSQSRVGDAGWVPVRCQLPRRLPLAARRYPSSHDEAEVGGQ